MCTRFLFAVAAVTAFAVGAVGLWYGFAMSFLVPGGIGEPYFGRERVLFGNLPLLGSTLALSFAGWLLVRSLPKRRLSVEQAILGCIIGAAGLGFLFAVVGAIIRQG